MKKIETYDEAVDFYGADAWLNSLAEECAELTKACLKLIRARDSARSYDKTCPRALYTPVTVEEAKEALEEEIRDVLTSIHNVTRFFPLSDMDDDKDSRLINWLNEKLGYTK